ncbi:Uncharacterized protein Fot_24672 [Forsythia ovata]|uniref:Uncharacterized protein n=1 Tax=Forsythia ovata TaxID=205694 RepID=A0ABD1U6Y1_9LAMI
MANRPTSELANLSSAAKRTTIGDVVLAKITATVKAIMTAAPCAPVSSYIKEIMAMAKIAQTRLLPPAIMLATRKLHLKPNQKHDDDSCQGRRQDFRTVGANKASNSTFHLDFSEFSPGEFVLLDEIIESEMPSKIVSDQNEVNDMLSFIGQVKWMYCTFFNLQTLLHIHIREEGSGKH